MKNLQQIKIIHHALEKEKARYWSELANLNHLIEKKRHTITKFKQYEHEYSQGESLALSRSVPTLNKNLHSFSLKIMDVILSEEKELEKLLNLHVAKLKELDIVQQKMQVMDKFAAEIRAQAWQQTENNEQATMDDLSAMRMTRGRHE